MTDGVLLEKRGAMALVTLDRPKALNAFDQPMASALLRVLDDIAQDTRIRAVLIVANGKYFCAGGDVRWFHELSQTNRETRQASFEELVATVHSVIEAIMLLPLPVVAAVQGGASGFGISLMAACDFVLSTPVSTFSSAYINLGASPDGGATWALPRIMGIRQARELILLSEQFDGEKALKLNLVNRLVQPDNLLAETLQLAERLAVGPTLAYGQLKRLLAQSFETNLPQQLKSEQHSFLEAVETRDFAEGLDALVTRRKANFVGQ